MTRSLTLKLMQTTFLLAVTSCFALPAQGQSAVEKLYKSKCAICHAADGSGNVPAGKSLQVRDFRSAEVQKLTDAQLFEIIAKGKKAMPGYEKDLKEAQIKEMVAYIRELAKVKKK